MFDTFFEGQALKIRDVTVVLDSNNDGGRPWKIFGEAVGLVLRVNDTGQIIETLIEGKIQRWDKQTLVEHSCPV